MVRESCTLTIRRQHDISTVSPRDHAHASGHTHSGQRPAWTARTHVTHTLTRTHMCVRSIPHAYGYPPTELVRRQSNGRTSGSAMLGQEHSEVRASPHVEVVGVQVVPVRRKTNARMHACFEGVSRYRIMCTTTIYRCDPQLRQFRPQTVTKASYFEFLARARLQLSSNSYSAGIVALRIPILGTVRCG